MIDTQQLKGAIVAAGYKSIGEAGKAIGLPQSTMYHKMRTGDFSMNEVDDMIVRYHIRHPEEIFLLGRKT